MLLKMQVYFIIFCFLEVFVHCKAAFDCNQSSVYACKDHTVSKTFPETEKELEIFCRQGINSLQCSIDFEENCKRDELPLDKARKLVNYLKEICRKNHPIYSVLVNNLKCVKPVMEDDDDVCRKDIPSEETFRNYSKALLDRGIDAFPGDEATDIDCLMALSMTACRAQGMEKCGKAAVDAFVNFSREVNNILIDYCGDNVGSYLPEIISVMNGREI